MHKAIIVAGLGFGDEGKGTTVDALVERHGSNLVVRYNGGAQAAHNVVSPDGRSHTFAQFGSGTLLGARTFLSRYMLIDPPALIREAKHLEFLGVPNPFSLLTIDCDAPIITPYHRLANRLREEMRGAEAHGSCGRGIGECRVDAMEHPEDYIRAADLIDATPLRDGHLFDKLKRSRERLVAEFPSLGPQTANAHVAVVGHSFLKIGKYLRIVEGDWLPSTIRSTGTTIFEGAQGVLLDQTHGFQPHTTWSDTTFAWADDLIHDAFEFDEVEIRRVGVIRAYHTRHGAGPLPTERPMALAEQHNLEGYAGAFRTGLLDLPLLRYAAAVCGGVDEIVVTHLDRRERWDVCTSWNQSVGERIVDGHLRSSLAPSFDSQRQLTASMRKLDPEAFTVEAVTGDQLVARAAWETGASVMARSFGATRLEKVWSA